MSATPTSGVKLRITYGESSNGLTENSQQTSCPAITITAPNAEFLPLHGGFRAALCYTEYLGPGGQAVSSRSLDTVISCGSNYTRLDPSIPGSYTIPYLEMTSLNAVAKHYAKRETFESFMMTPGSEPSATDEKVTARSLAYYMNVMQQKGLEIATKLLQSNGLSHPVVSVIAAGSNEDPPAFDEATRDLWARAPLQDRTTHVHITLNGDRSARQYVLYMDPLDEKAMSLNAATTQPLSAQFWAKVENGGHPMVE
jgi:hypothetical protein